MEGTLFFFFSLSSCQSFQQVVLVYYTDSRIEQNRFLLSQFLCPPLFCARAGAHRRYSIPTIFPPTTVAANSSSTARFFSQKRCRHRGKTFPFKQEKRKKKKEKRVKEIFSLFNSFPFLFSILFKSCYLFLLLLSIYTIRRYTTLQIETNCKYEIYLYIDVENRNVQFDFSVVLLQFILIFFFQFCIPPYFVKCINNDR